MLARKFSGKNRPAAYSQCEPLKMRIRQQLFIALSLSLSLPSCSKFSSRELVKLPAAENSRSLDSLQAQIVFKYARHFPNGTQLSLCIISGDSEKYVGIQRRNDSLIYMDNSDSVFGIGSITKTLTGTMLAKLVYDGKIDLNEPIKNLLPVHLNQSSLNGREITLVHLANHTSGLPFEPTNVKDNKEHPFDPYNPYRYYDTARLYDYLSHQLALESTPGEKRTYSNLGVGLLGHILTLISSRSFEDLLFETVCVPLGMRNTFVTLNEERKRSMVRGRDPKGQVLPYDDGDCGALTGAGGGKSSVRDLVKFLRANMSDTTYFYLAQKTTKVFDEHLTGGLGWATYSDLGKHHVGAFGATGGYTSGVIFERSKRVGVVVLTNVSAFLASEGNYTEGLCRGLYDPLPFDSERKQ
jgi:CubicO group peptidase (beta-lactamase class C family)